jgi:hypothetical protein
MQYPGLLNKVARDWFSSLPVPPLLSSFCNISSTSLRVDSTPGTNRMNRRQIETTQVYLKLTFIYKSNIEKCFYIVKRNL